MKRKRLLGSSVLILASCVSGGLLQPPIKPPPAWIGCYDLATNIDDSYRDSLGYEIPEVIQLGYTSHGQWIVLPTDREWHPSWTVYDGLPSSHERLVRGWQETHFMNADSVRLIPGDSIDISFPSAIGNLVFRLGGRGESLGGRAEWVVHGSLSYLNEGRTVDVSPSDCEGLQLALVRSRYRFP